MSGVSQRGSRSSSDTPEKNEANDTATHQNGHSQQPSTVIKINLRSKSQAGASKAPGVAKSGRGRKSSSPESNKSAVSSPSDKISPKPSKINSRTSKGDTAAKSKPGRPPASKGQAAETARNSTKNGPSTTRNVQSTATPSKRRPGRPVGSGKKAKADSSKEPSPSSAERTSARLRAVVKEAPALNASPVIIETRKRGPGRPRKDLKPEPRVFVEPSLSTEPSYTGFPLETPPSAKVRKESLWPAKYTKLRANSNSSNSREGSSGLDEAEIEAECIKNLKTKLSEQLSKESTLRNPVKPKRKYSKVEEQATPRPRNLKSYEFDRVHKRVKVISPRKPNTTLALSPVIKSKPSPPVESGPARDNEDFCSSCGGSGIFICCEGCPKSFHFTCCDPPLEEVPVDDWYCKECSALRNPGVMVQWNDVGIFSELLNQAECRNPAEFELPRYLRDNTFIGIKTGANGEYTDDTQKPEAVPLTKKAAASGPQINGYNRDPTLEIDSLYDQENNPYLCHKCGESGLNNRVLTHCDYCPLVYHIDCLNEPMFGPKTIGSKWRCPNHIENLLPDVVLHQAWDQFEESVKKHEVSKYKLRNFKDALVVNPSLKAHFLKVASLSNILIKYDDQPDIGSNRNLQEYMKYQQQDFKKLRPEYTDLERTRYKDAEDEEIDQHPQFCSPDYFQNSIATRTGVSAEIPDEMSRLICLSSSHEAGTSFIYRVPERSIVLDFVSKVAKGNAKQRILDSIRDYECKTRIETNETEREAVNGLAQLQKPKLDFHELVNVALNEKKQISTPPVTESELDELLEIKRLMQIKGRDKLVEFLRHEKTA